MTTFYWIFGFVFPFLCTSLGALCILIKFKKSDTSGLALGFSAGVMIAASCWSLLMPSIEMSSEMGHFAFIPAVLGMLIGGLFIYILDIALKNSITKRESKLFWAVTIHNIPEGLAVGFAFGSPAVPVLSAFSIALAIGLQNFPEGLAVALPFVKDGKGRRKGVIAGILSGIVEPIGALFGALLAYFLIGIQPWILSFAAGAMLYVSACELIPDGCKGNKGTWAFMIGFAIMTVLDIAFA